MNSSIQRELNYFFGKVSDSDFDIHEVSKGALTQARAKLNYTAFKELSQDVLDGFYTNETFEKWHGKRLLAIDGSTLNLPSHESVKKEFGEMHMGPNRDVIRPMARVSICYDVLNLMSINALIEPYETNERVLVESNITELDHNSDDLLLFDMGYPSMHLMYRIVNMGKDFCMRMELEKWLIARDFMDSEEKDRLYEIELPKKDLHYVKQYNGITNKLTIRLIKVEQENGSITLLATSLIDVKKYPRSEFRDLYHLRWGIEEYYKLAKQHIELEKFSGKTALSIKQDFYAKLFMLNVCAMMGFPLREKIKKQRNPANKVRKINNVNNICTIRGAWIKLITGKIEVEQFLLNLDKILSRSIQFIKKGRSNPRKKKPKRPPYHNKRNTSP